jgi:hypothetical protein
MKLYFLSPETLKPDWYPTTIVPQPFGEFFLSLFEILRTRSLKLSIPKSLPPLLPELWKTKMSKIPLQRHTAFHDFRIFNAKDPQLLVIRISRMPNPEIPKFQNFTPENPFCDSGIR